jgi:acyl carrier protein
VSIRAKIVSVFTEVAAEQDKVLRSLSDESGLLECGLDSLCFAIIVARLEDELNLDPFSDADVPGFPVTVGDFIRLYENAATAG